MGVAAGAGSMEEATIALTVAGAALNATLTLAGPTRVGPAATVRVTANGYTWDVASAAGCCWLSVHDAPDGVVLGPAGASIGPLRLASGLATPIRSHSCAPGRCGGLTRGGGEVAWFRGGWVSIHDAAPPTPPSTSATVVLLLLFFTAWVTWTENLSQDVLAGRDAPQMCRLVQYAAIITNAVAAAAAMKAWTLFQVPYFFPSVMEDVFGPVASTVYAYAFVAGACVLAAAVTGVLYRAAAPRTSWRVVIVVTDVLMPKWLGDVGRDHPGATLVVVRMAVETVLITAVHAAAPHQLGRGLMHIIGLAGGAALSVVVGRDVCLCAWLGSPRLAGLVGGLILVHAAVFMVADTLSSNGLAPREAVAMGLALAVQMACTGGHLACNLWAARPLRGR